MDEQNVEFDMPALLQLFGKTVRMKFEYFEMLTAISSKNAYLNLIAKNLTKMSMSDQLCFLKLMRKQSTLAETLCGKYGWNPGGEDND